MISGHSMKVGVRDSDGAITGRKVINQRRIELFNSRIVDSDDHRCGLVRPVMHEKMSLDICFLGDVVGDTSGDSFRLAKG